MKDRKQKKSQNTRRSSHFKGVCTVDKPTQDETINKVVVIECRKLRKCTTKSGYIFYRVYQGEGVQSDNLSQLQLMRFFDANRKRKCAHPALKTLLLTLANNVKTRSSPQYGYFMYLHPPQTHTSTFTHFKREGHFFFSPSKLSALSRSRRRSTSGAAA